MNHDSRLPLSLVLIATSYILLSGLKLAAVIFNFPNHRYLIDLTLVVDFLIGVGLLRWWALARSAAIIYACLAMICIPVFMVLVWIFPGPINAHILDLANFQISKPVSVISGGILWGIAFYEFKILTRPSIRALF